MAEESSAAPAPAPAAPPPAAPEPRGHADTVVVTQDNADAFYAERLAEETANAEGRAPQAPATQADEDAALADADAAAAETEAERTERRRKPIAERIGDLTRQRNEERAERERLQAEVDRFKAAAPPPPAPAPPAEPPPPAPAPAPAPAAATPEADPEPDENAYTDAFAYARDLARWESRRAVQEALATERRETAARAEEQRAQQVVQTFQTRMATYRGATSDFDAVVGASVAPTSEHVRSAIIESDDPGPLVYHLAKNPALLAEIQALPPATQARRIGRLEAELSRPAAAPAPGPAPLRRVATPLPDPIQPVRPGANASGGADLDPNQPMPYDKYKEARLAGRIK